MIKRLKKLTIISLVVSMVFGLLTIKNIYAIANLENGNKVLEINNIDLGYHGIIETIYNDETIHKYRLTEFGESFDLIIDIDNNKVYIDNHELSFEDYMEIIEKQVSALKTRINNETLSLASFADSFAINNNALLRYEEKHLVYLEKERNHFHDININTRCTTCPLKTTSVPTSNYRTTEIDIGEHSTALVVTLTVGAISAFAGFCTYGATQIATTIITGFLSMLGAAVSNAIVTYRAYQSFHNICYKAVQERHLIWVQDSATGLTTADNSYHYFYMSRP